MCVRQSAGRRASETRAEPHMQVLGTHTEPCGVPVCCESARGALGNPTDQGKMHMPYYKHTTVEHIATDFPCRC